MSRIWPGDNPSLLVRRTKRTSLPSLSASFTNSGSAALGVATSVKNAHPHRQHSHHHRTPNFNTSPHMAKVSRARGGGKPERVLQTTLLVRAASALYLRDRTESVPSLSTNGKHEELTAHDASPRTFAGVFGANSRDHQERLGDPAYAMLEGRRSSTSVPAPASLHIASFPPTSSARSGMPRRP